MTKKKAKFGNHMNSTIIETDENSELTESNNKNMNE